MPDAKSSSRKTPSRHIGTIVASVITASAVILAALIGADAKHDRDRASAEIERLKSELSERDREALPPRAPTATIAGSTLSQQPTVSTTMEPSGGASSLEASGSVGNQPSSPNLAEAKNDKPDRPLAKAERQGIQIGFYGCTRSSGEIRCEISATNLREEREVEFLAALSNPLVCRVIDDAGRERRASRLELAGKEGTFIKIDLPSNASIKGFAVFEDIGSTKSFSVFQVAFKITYHLDTYSVTFPKVHVAA